MNLLDVGVDLWGFLVAPGQITCRQDQSGHFGSGGYSHLRVDARAESIRLVGTKVWRDSQSGFLVSEEVPPVVVLPQSLSLLIRDALKREPSSPVHAALVNVNGEIRSQLSQTGGEHRTLSDWTLDISVEEENLRIVIAGALPGPGTVPRRGLGATNLSTAANQEQFRVACKFDVNLPTRIAAFGGGKYDCPDSAISPTSPVGALVGPRPKLSETPISLAGQILAQTAGNGWLAISDEGSALSLVPCHDLSRGRNGFVVSCASQAYPRIWLGIALDQIISMTPLEGKSVSKEVSQYCIKGYADGANMEQGQIQARLVDCGLELSNSLTGKFTISWEILILRYPKIGRLNPRAKKY